MTASEQLLFSIIIPVYNRPQEIDELLHSLTLQTYRDFEVLVVEDGSIEDARARAELIGLHASSFGETSWSRAVTISESFSPHCG